MRTALDFEPLVDEVSRHGFAFAPSAQMRPLLGVLADWEAFAASWNDLPRDTHLPDGHRYCRRRHATLSARGGESGFRVEPHQPHYQGLEYNALVGGIQRWFEPVSPRVVTGQTFGAVIALCLGLFGRLRPEAEWRIECHQFRIEASPAAPGQPTPEGVHRDGVDYVLVLLVNRVNVESGRTTVHALDGEALGSFTLGTPLDAALVDDARVQHGVTAVHPVNPAHPAYRDVLVVTFRAVRDS